MKREGQQEIDVNQDFKWGEMFGWDVGPYTQIHRFEAGEEILREGERPHWLYYLVRGKAKLYLTHENGRITLVNFLTAPCFLGEMELLDETKDSDGVKAMTQCVCFAIPMDLCKDRLLNDPKFLRYLCRFLSKKAVGNTANYSRNQTFPLKNRLALFILETSIDGVYRQPHTETAEYLGVTYRHLLYVMAGFAEQGLLAKTSGGYRIMDRDMLQELAAETGYKDESSGFGRQISKERNHPPI